MKKFFQIYARVIYVIFLFDSKFPGANTLAINDCFGVDYELHRLWERNSLIVVITD